MSDEFKNINDTGTEPDNRTEKPLENQNEESYTKGEYFVMRNSQESETDSQQQITLPGNQQEKRKTVILLISLLPLSRQKRKQKRKRILQELPESLDSQQPVQQCSDW